MRVSGIEQAAQTLEIAQAQNELKSLMELQGELIVKLIESSKIPGPTDRTTDSEMGKKFDFHI
jgi:hypothetical protein